jgi:phosphomevalonate kinase
MEKITNEIVITRTPGKILICGGYLVISPSYRGLIFNSETYFKCEGKFLKLDEPSQKDGNLIISVFSKNFNQSFKYELEIKHDFKLNQTEIYLNQIEGTDNRFVESSIINSFYFFFLKNYNNIDKIITKFLHFSKENNLILNLEADYRFYTYDKTFFNSENTNKDEEKKINVKTGLGSSSGLICSLNTNILILLSECFTENKDSHKEISTLKQLSLQDQANVLLSSYFSNNQAQQKVDVYL